MTHNFDSPFHDHATAPRGRDRTFDNQHRGAAGGSACGDLLSIAVELRDGLIASAGFEAEGCVALTACASATVELVEGRSPVQAARIGRNEIAEVLGGLGPERIHAAVLAEEALHRALGALIADPETALDPVAGRVLVAVSGGVDSAVAALLLGETGRDRVAVTLQLWDDPATDGTASCCSPQAVTAARRMVHEMGMPHFTVDLRDQFRTGVIAPYIAAFEQALTPNPCVGCNGHVRFDALDELRRRIGAQTLATGHYARIERDGHGALLAAATDRDKDQTYMLAAVDPQLLDRIEFPLGDLVKPRVRELAARAGLAVAEKPESQDLCFLAGIGRDDFLERHAGQGDRPGDVIDTQGRRLGSHRGAHRFTVGQRRGLGVAAPRPLYVLDVDAGSNTVTVGTLEQLDTTLVQLVGARLLRDGSEIDRVKLRYRNAPVACRVEDAPEAGRHGRLQLKLEAPVAGAAPGQIACLMRGGQVVGWATIARSEGLRSPSSEASVGERAKLPA